MRARLRTAIIALAANHSVALTLLHKVWRVVRELGPSGAACYLLHRLSARTGGLLAVHSYLFVAQPVPAEPLLPARRGHSIMVRRLDPQDPLLLALPLTEAVLSYRAGLDAVCFAAFKEEAIIGCLWLCLSFYDEDEVRCRYRPTPAGEASWDFDVYLAPEHRSGLGFARLWDEANAFLRPRGVAFSWSRISAFNPVSLASHARLGARVAGRATFLRLGPCQFMVASLPPHWHLSFRRSDRPAITLRNPTQ
jgi:hypothetical protein